MWTSSDCALPSVLIVEGENGDVFIVENKESEPQVEKILKTEKSSRPPWRPRRKKQEIKIEAREPSPIDLKSEIKEEEENVEYLEFESLGNNDQAYSAVHVPFIDPNKEILSKGESTLKIEEVNSIAEFVFEPPTFDGRWSSDEEEELEHPEKEPVKRSPKKKASVGSRSGFWSHKARSLAGKIACKYCDTVFSSKAERSMHICKYLKCDPRNFICRICKKELSKKTFSNHLHETLDCQYCGKQFVNPRNMKTHIERQHKGEKFIPLKPKTIEMIAKTAEIGNYGESSQTQQEVMRNTSRYTKAKKRLECDLCGKYLVSVRSMSYHMSLHTGQTCYICENCGEKFYTPNGIKGHSCEKKRRRPEVDFRTYDLRHCRFCNSSFASYDENKAHLCDFQVPDDPKSVYCRCCGKILLKLAFNRHMEIHSGIDWQCTVCCRKLATERALKVHMTTHSGNKPYKCKLCAESFINKVVLDRHMRFHGASVKCFRCEFCFKELSTQTSLQSHLQRVHKPTAQCELCKIEFSNREQLKHHMTDAHEPSVCQICNKSFTLPRYLKMHEKLHFDDSSPRVQCMVCSKFLTIKNIKSHVFRKHPDEFEAWQQTNPTL